MGPTIVPTAAMMQIYAMAIGMMIAITTTEMTGMAGTYGRHRDG